MKHEGNSTYENRSFETIIVIIPDPKFLGKNFHIFFGNWKNCISNIAKL